MRCVVTGVAGFVGSHLAEQLIGNGYEVVGIDCFTPYYDPLIKRSNLSNLLTRSRFTLVEGDLATMDLEPALKGADFVFHQAGQAGVRSSWGNSFELYTHHNVLATQRLLEAMKNRPECKLVYASSSSVYGNAPLPMSETTLPRPISPYGVTKLAGEHLCHLYHASYGVPYVALRYFTVYGPRQRPDMGICRFISAIMQGELITVYGDGTQSRDFTYVEDVVQANILAALAPVTDTVINICGGSQIVLRDLLTLLQDEVGKPALLSFAADQLGDVNHTAADSSRARALLNFVPTFDLVEGVRQQVAWQRSTKLALAV